MSETLPRPNNGQFTRGASGNPLGRPAGSRNQKTRFLEALLEADAEELMRKNIEMAKAGNRHALQFCLERLMPLQKNRSVSFDFPPVESLADISLAMKRITASVAGGDITPDEGEAVSRILVQHSNIIVNHQLEQRVAKLERPPSSHEKEVQIVTIQR